MVWVCPPHTSMNLKCSSGPPARARVAMAPNSLRAAAGSRNSSTKRITVSFALEDRGGVEGLDLVGVGVAESLDRGQCQQRLGLVDLGHREPDMHQHPLVG